MENARDVIKRMIDNGGSLLIKCAEVLHSEEFFFQPRYGASMAWTLGHLAAFQDWSMSNIDPLQQRKLGSEVREFFRGGKIVSQGDVEKYYQSADDLIELYKSTQERSIQTLDKFDVNRWRDPTPTGCRYATLGEIWESIAYENFWHLGQISSSVPRIAGTALSIPVPRPYKLPFERAS